MWVVNTLGILFDIVFLLNETTEELEQLLSPYLPIYGFSVEEFFDGGGVALIHDKDVALFEHDSDKVYSGHYFFKSRGNKALSVAGDFLRFFYEKLDPKIIKGLVPLEHLGARWMTRQLGFKSYGVVQTVIGPCELFILTKKDWEQTNE